MPATGGIRIELRGPLLESNGSRALRFFRDAAEEVVREGVEAGEQKLDEELRPRPAGVYLSVAQAAPGHASTGNYRRNVSGRVRGTEGVITDGGVVYGSRLEGIGSRNQTTRFKGYATFRRVAQWLERFEIPLITRRVSARLASRLRR